MHPLTSKRGAFVLKLGSVFKEKNKHRECGACFFAFCKITKGWIRKVALPFLFYLAAFFLTQGRSDIKIQRKCSLVRSSMISNPSFL